MSMPKAKRQKAAGMRDYLYEKPGPKLRKKIIIGTVIVLIAIAIIVALIVRQFYITGQLSPRYWSFFLKPTTWNFLMKGFIGTLEVSITAGIMALVLGMVFMFGRISTVKPVAVVSRIIIDFFRGVPSLLLIYLFFLVLPKYGIKFSSFWTLTLPVALSASGVLAEVFRAGFNAVPKGQTEAATALGMRRMRINLKIIMPQAIKYVIPTLISQLVIVVKDTTVAYVVSFPDLLQNARVLITNYDALVSVYFIAAIIYIVLNYVINKVSVYVANRMGVTIVRPK